MEPALKSICEGSLHPNHIFLHLSTAAFGHDEGVSEVPEFVLKYPVKICWGENHGPYRKLLPTLRKFWNKPDYMVVTCDDDWIYPSFWLERMVEAAELHTDKCICYAARRIAVGGDGKIRPYVEWENLRSSYGLTQADRVLALGGHGVLYRPRFFNSEIFDVQKAFEVAQFCDDFWFSGQLCKRGVSVRVLESCWEDFDHLELDFPLWDDNKDRNNQYAINAKRLFGFW